jgi:hypothetical protein
MKNILKWEQFLNETLLKSYDKDDVIKYLVKLGIDKDSIFDKGANKVCLTLNHKNKKYVSEIISKLEYFFGWYLAGVEGDFYDDVLSGQDFKNDELENIDILVPEPEEGEDVGEMDDYYSLIFEPKYDIEIMDTDKPNILWYITDEKYITKIKKNGLVPKTKSKITYHPERIYFLKDIKFVSELLQHMKFDVENPIILKIDVSKIKSKLRMYEDVNYPNGLYVTDNISPEYIIEYLQPE